MAMLMEKEKPTRPRHRITQKALIVACCCAVLFVALGLGVIGFLWSEKVYRDGQSGLQAPLNTESSTSTTALPEPVVAPTAQPGLDSLTIKRAMANCDAEAAKNPDGLYFLLTPVMPANFESATLLLPPGENYESFFLSNHKPYSAVCKMVLWSSVRVRTNFLSSIQRRHGFKSGAPRTGRRGSRNQMRQRC